MSDENGDNPGLDDHWMRRMPPEMATAHLNLDAATLRKTPSEKQEIIAG